MTAGTAANLAAIAALLGRPVAAFAPVPAGAPEAAAGLADPAVRRILDAALRVPPGLARAAMAEAIERVAACLDGADEP